MIVFGEGSRRERSRAKLAGIGELLASIPSGRLQRHEILVAALIEAGELAQAVADRDSAASGEDRHSLREKAAMTLCLAIARAVWRSWTIDFDGCVDGADIANALAALDRTALPDELDVRQPEGFAHYAVYPEAYGEAALAAAQGRPAIVIGIRSIGTTLAAIAAAALPDAPMPVTVRPTGHPFRRELRLGRHLLAALRPADGQVHLVADEGPGLSGSSMAAVVESLAQTGAPARSIHLLPSHAGEPGPEADEAVRQVWRSAPRHVRTFDDLFGASAAPARRIEAWAADLVGASTAPAVDISGGAWRNHRHLARDAWPPVHGWGERRKFLVETESGTWLLKFAGLDRTGRAKASLAAALAEAGWTAPHAGMRHGFVVEQWVGGAQPLDPDGPDRGAFLRRLGAYLGFRSRACPAAVGGGGTPDGLLAMAMTNAAEALGEGIAARLDRWRPALDRLSRAARPVATDGRLQAWEWLNVGGRWLKADALDHHASHDLIGCQDIAWDIAGATIEFGLSDLVRNDLATVVEREAGRPVDPDLVAFLCPVYAAFQLGAWTLAAAGADPSEGARLRATIERYRRRLSVLLDEDGRGGDCAMDD